MDMQEAGKTIKKHREIEKLSQQKLAGHFNIPVETIKSIEDGSIEEIGIRQLSVICMRSGLVIQVKPETLPTFDELLKQNQEQRIKDLKTTDDIIAQELAKISSRTHMHITNQRQQTQTQHLKTTDTIMLKKIETIKYIQAYGNPTTTATPQKKRNRSTPTK